MYIELALFAAPVVLVVVIFLTVYFSRHKKYPDGSKYHGRLKKGKRDGKGTMKYADGSIYNGEWSQDRRSGKGTMRYSNRDVYTGEWRNDLRWGTGELKKANRDHYRGSWYNGYMNGHGVYTWRDGSSYEGEWLLGRRSGKGRMKWPNRQQYAGFWMNDLFHGKGVLLYPDESESIGTWDKGVFVSGKFIPCKRTDGSLSYFIKKGEITSSKESNVKDGYFRNDIRVEIPYGNFHMIAHVINKRKWITSDKHYVVLSLGNGKQLFKFIEKLEQLSELYTDKSVKKALSGVPSIFKVIQNKGIDGFTSYENYKGDFCLEQSIELGTRFNETHLSDKLKKAIRHQVEFAQDFIHELNHFNFDSSLLVIDPEKEAKLIAKAKFKANVKRFGFMVGRKLLIGAAMTAVAAITGQVLNIDLPDGDTDGGPMPDFDGMGGLDFIDSDGSLLLADMVVPVLDVTDIADMDIDGHMTDISSSFSGIDASDADLPAVDVCSAFDAEVEKWRQQTMFHEQEFLDSYDTLADTTAQGYDDMISKAQSDYERHLEEATKADSDYWRNYHKRQADIAKSRMDDYERYKREAVASIGIDKSRQKLRIQRTHLYD